MLAGTALMVGLSAVAGLGGSVVASAVPSVPGQVAQVPTEDTIVEAPPIETTPIETTPVDTTPVEGTAEEPAPDSVAGEPDVDPTADETDADTGAVDAENRRILLIILGLVAVAIALALLTIRYWRQTKPVPPPVDEADDGAEEDPEDALFEAIRAREPRTSRVAVPEAAIDDEDDHDDDPYEDDPFEDDDPYADLFEPVAEPSRRSRRAVAGADHPEVDEEWVPRGTGEHDLIDVAEAPAISKPSVDQRAAAFRAKGEH